MADKKKYTAPEITEHGKVTEETKGISNVSWEVYGHQAPQDYN